MKTTYYITLLFLNLLLSCNSQNQEAMEHKYTNDLIHETSPYLLQHAHNPVNWKAWNEASLQEAKEQNKLLLISVGYAACHWCHVMEHESFEDEVVAQVMNENYINIKIDREERPDIDQVYMSAVQLMTRRGGWPMNVVALPDGRPVWGGTYFPKGEWMGALNQIAKIYQDDPEKLIEYADKLTKGVQQMSLVEINEQSQDFKSDSLLEAVAKWSRSFDYKKGGLDYAPKFMMPNNYHFLMRYAHQTKDQRLKDYVVNTLNQISFGGVYDHVGGGFARYSVDEKWHVPHFEKMLYDNGQLVSLYSDAYLLTGDEWYKQVVYETLDFVANDWTTPEGAFYSSLDADSLTETGELEEGAFYVWKKQELQDLLKEDFELFADYYNINAYGHWEHGNYVLIRNTSDTEFLAKHELDKSDFFSKQQQWKSVLLKERNKRSAPRLDDKVLTSWNALMLQGYVDAYRVFNEPKFLEAALKNARFIHENQLESDGQLWHNYKNGKSTINGYLEDYATVIQAYLSLYEITFEEEWLYLAQKMADYVQEHFYDGVSKMYYFTSNLDAPLMARSVEYTDNVIPASNSIMAKNWFRLYHYLGNVSYQERATSMLHNMTPNFFDYPSGYSNWMDLHLNYSQPFYEVAICGASAEAKHKELNAFYIPNKLVAGATEQSNIPLLKDRFKANETYIFVCQDKACQLPVQQVSEAVKQLQP